MKKHIPPIVEFEDEGDELDVAEELLPGSLAAFVSGNDWTTETIVSQLDRGNIKLNPRFQRRDAWKRDRKSRFIESLIVGLPIPQIVLAEAKDERGKFIVIDGKQRLLSIFQFWGLGDSENNAYALSGLTLRSDLNQKRFTDLSTSPELQGDFTALSNQAIRTVVIRNWKDSNFLHTVFLRLNTGSVKLSPQELRQALLPGPFSDYVDETAATSPALRQLLGVTGADPRMRDIEILARFLAFRFFAETYPGRMKAFLDSCFHSFNSRWKYFKPEVDQAVQDFEEGVEALFGVFGEDVARKPDSRQFNRAIFDALIYFHSRPEVRRAVGNKKKALRAAYDRLFAANSGFLKAVESDTAGAPNTLKRLRVWADSLSGVAGRLIQAPKIPVAGSKRRHSAKQGKDKKRSRT
jgi:hypothetical protein